MFPVGVEVVVFNMISDVAQSGSPPTAAFVGESWVVNTWGGGYTDGEFRVWDGSSWHPCGSVRPGVIVVVNMSGMGTPAGSFSGLTGKLLRRNDADDGWVEYGGNYRPLMAMSRTDPTTTAKPVFRGFSGWETGAENLVRRDSAITLGQADDGKTFVTISGDEDPVVFTLPTVAKVGTEYSFIGDSANCKITVPTGVTLRMPWGNVTNDSIEGEDDRGDLEASLRIVAETSTSWAVRYGTGGWLLSSDSAKRIWYDGWVQGAGEDNLPAFDAYGAIKDSGYSSRRVTECHGGMYVTGGGASAIDTAGAWHAYQSATLPGAGMNMTEYAGTSGSDISAYATHDSGASTKVTTSSAHGLAEGDIITITGTTNYNDVFEVIEIVDTTNFVIDKAWDTNDDATGTYTRPDALKVDENFTGYFLVTWSFGGSIGTGAAECEFGVFLDKELQFKIPNKFQTAGELEAVAGVGRVYASPEGKAFWFGIMNNDNTNSITIEEMEFVVHRL